MLCWARSAGTSFSTRPVPGSRTTHLYPLAFPPGRVRLLVRYHLPGCTERAGPRSLPSGPTRANSTGLPVRLVTIARTVGGASWAGNVCGAASRARRVPAAQKRRWRVVRRNMLAPFSDREIPVRADADPTGRWWQVLGMRSRAESACYPLFGRGGDHPPPAVRTGEARGREGQSFFLWRLVS